MRILCLFLSLLILTGCAPLLERTYSTAEPHSSKFWESEAAGTLRAESHQDIVNDLLFLIGQHTETATLRLYNFESELAVADTLEAAAAEIKQETPLGSYAVEYITSSRQSQRGFYEASVQISYRRTLEQIQSVVNATSPAALYSLLDAALEEGREELAVRLGYWDEEGTEQVAAAMTQLREERELTETLPWAVFYYPSEEQAGLIEFILGGEELEALAARMLPESGPAPAEEGVPADGETSAESGAPEVQVETPEISSEEPSPEPAEEIDQSE